MLLVIPQMRALTNPCLFQQFLKRMKETRQKLSQGSAAVL